MINEFNISFSLLTLKKDIITFPFRIVLQTKTKDIEEYCVNTWPELLTETRIHNTTDKLNQLKMEKYIKNSLTTDDIDTIHKEFYERKYFDPVEFSFNLSQINLTDFDAKYWTDANYPYLEIKGQISIDLKKTLDFYLKKKWILIKTISKLIKDNVKIKFKKELPLLVRYIESKQVKDYVLQYFTYEMSKRTILLKSIEKKLRLKHLDKFKKDINYAPDGSILIVINDYIKLMQKKTTRNFIPLTAAGFIAYNLLNKKEIK